MENSICALCGGCFYRTLGEEKYRKNKAKDFEHTMSLLKNATPTIDAPIFINDSSRRRAEMEFLYSKKELKMGFNQQESHNLINIESCFMLDSVLNSFLTPMRKFLTEFCQIKTSVKNKKKIETKSITQGSVQFLHADNGIDILLKIKDEPSLEHRLLIADFVNYNQDIIRFSWQINNSLPETIVAKNFPELYISEYAIEIPQGVFLQASKEAENKMIEKMISYMGTTTGKIADLFCGLGTFTYPLAKNKLNEIISVDSSSSSTEGLKKALNRNQIHNVKVINKNLFKYPLDEAELKDIKALVIDPPRAGAHEQCREISKISGKNRPEKIIFVSCNPKTFVYDAQLLIDAGYTFERVTLIDQFVYSKHQELIALFTYNSVK